MKVSVEDALGELRKSGKLFVKMFSHGTLSLEMYKPRQVDLQQPHSRDEVYVVTSGAGDFYLAGKKTTCKSGDFLFVPAGADHRFENFSPDFATWVIFYGPEGGENDRR